MFLLVLQQSPSFNCWNIICPKFHWLLFSPQTLEKILNFLKGFAIYIFSWLFLLNFIWKACQSSTWVRVEEFSCSLLMYNDTYARVDQDLKTFSIGFFEQSIYHRPDIGEPSLLSTMQDVVSAVHSGRLWELMAWWNSIMINPTVWFQSDVARLLPEWH